MAIPNKGLSSLKQEKMEDDHDIGGFDGEVSDSETGSESELEEDKDGDVKLTEPSKNAIYNTEGLIDKLGYTSWPDNVGWIHKLSIDIDQEQQVDVNDDLARELAFYNQALEGTRRAFEKLQSMGLPFLTPADYYAELVKTDSHMEKVKGRLLVEKRRMEEADERKKAREAEKLAKEIQAQKTKERNKQKKRGDRVC
ncbi:Eukaryotic rRNA processing [Parasponia andersonii]|uniref:Eukaryotic rRNA processing n=1 Tax=Parasponia andersonii TaxID=3476 RepID=A0A2P5C5A5_PARAD|nr:Eukaryotic rRNA processing [Parasponia andersonii]